MLPQTSIPMVVTCNTSKTETVRATRILSVASSGLDEAVKEDVCLSVMGMFPSELEQFWV